MQPFSRSFTALIPVLALVVSIAPVLGLIVLNFYSLKHAAHGSDSISVGTTDYRFVIQSDSFLRFAFISATLRAQRPITILDAPAHFVNLPISYVMSRTP